MDVISSFGMSKTNEW